MNDENAANFDWRKLLPERGYRSAMAVRRGMSVTDYFNQPGDAALLVERQYWLSVSPHEYAGFEADAGELLREFVAIVSPWIPESLRAFDPLKANELCVTLGKNLAPDWVLMRADEQGTYRLAAGSVCFPSSWALRDKLGKPIDAIHAPVPGLNEELSPRIHAFLSNLPVEQPWERSNISFSGNAELNHHPTRTLPRLGAHSTLDSAWVRFERQFFFKLPRTGAIVFGIRVSHHGFNMLAQNADGALRLAHALRTMSDEMAVYKGMTAARSVLIEQLERAAK